MGGLHHDAGALTGLVVLVVGGMTVVVVAGGVPPGLVGGGVVGVTVVVGVVVAGDGAPGVPATEHERRPAHREVPWPRRAGRRVTRTRPPAAAPWPAGVAPLLAAAATWPAGVAPLLAGVAP